MKRNIIPFIQFYCLLFIITPLFSMRKSKSFDITGSEILQPIYDEEAAIFRQFITTKSKDISEQSIKTIDQIRNIRIGLIVFNCNLLMGATITGNKKKCHYLITKLNAKVNKKNNEQRTALSFAAEYGRLAITKMLVKAKAEINLTDNKSWSPLMYAAHHNHEKIVEFLLQHNATNNNRTNASHLTQNKKIKKLIAANSNPIPNPFYKDI